VSDTLRYLDGATVESLLPDWDQLVDLLAATYVALADGDAHQPPKLGIHPREGAFLHAMPAHVGGDDEVTALKWVAAYPGNREAGLPSVHALIVVNDSATGVPVAVMDGTAITTARTAAASGVSLRHLAPDGWSRVGILGWGVQGRAHAEMVQALRPDAEVVAYAGPGRPVPDGGVASAEEAVRDADVVITCGPMTHDASRAIDPGWLRDDVLVLPVDYSAAVGADVVASADDLVTDDLAQLEASRASGWFAGWRTPDASLGERVRTGRVGRRTVSCSLGLGVADAATAGRVLRAAEEHGIGTLLPR